MDTQDLNDIQVIAEEPYQVGEGEPVLGILEESGTLHCDRANVDFSGGKKLSSIKY